MGGLFKPKEDTMGFLGTLAVVGALVWAPIPLPDADVDAPVRAIPVHDA